MINNPQNSFQSSSCFIQSTNSNSDIVNNDKYSIIHGIKEDEQQIGIKHSYDQQLNKTDVSLNITQHKCNNYQCKLNTQLQNKIQLSLRRQMLNQQHKLNILEELQFKLDELASNNQLSQDCFDILQQIICKKE